LKVSRLTLNISKTSNVDHQKSNIRVIAAIPCFNTARTIADVVTKTMKYVDEVIVVDDGSNDKTAEVARAAGARVISHNKNLGKGAAMKTAAESAECDILVFIDGDAQHKPEEIPLLLKPIVQGNADFVVGSRYLIDSKTYTQSFYEKNSQYFCVFCDFIYNFYWTTGIAFF